MSIIAVVGPTGTGKSELALDLAEALGQWAGRPGGEVAEVVNADAFQLYRGMDIGTAKVPAAERRGIAHHQLDVLDVDQDAAVAAYQRGARTDLSAVLDRGRIPLLVGGSGLYVRAALDDVEFPPTNPQVRAELEARAQTEGSGALYRELLATDPEAAQKIDPANVRRVVRALEVCQVAARPFSSFRHGRHYVRPTLQIGLLPPEDLGDRLARRARGFFTAGLLAETEALLARGLAPGTTAWQAIGYPQAAAVLAGDLAEPEAVADITAATLRLVKRQRTWFRADPRIEWITPERRLDQALDLIAKRAPRLEL